MIDIVSHCVGGRGNERNSKKKTRVGGCGTSSLCAPNIAATPHSTRELNYCMFLFIKCVFVSSPCHSEDRAFILLVYTHNNPEKLHILKSLYACLLVGS